LLHRVAPCCSVLRTLIHSRPHTGPHPRREL